MSIRIQNPLNTRIQTRINMGANLVPRVSGFYVEKVLFDMGSPVYKVSTSIRNGCIDPGEHRVIWFDLFLNNIGNANFVIGNPASRPDVFLFSPTRFKEKFYTWRLTDNTGAEKSTGFKVAFCIMDFGQGGFNCQNQGVSVGSHDLYDTNLPCQFVKIDNLPDGMYTLHVTANAYTVQQVKNGQQPLPGLEEDNYEDNTISIQLHLKGDNVSVVDEERNQNSQIKAEFGG